MRRTAHWNIPAVLAALLIPAISIAQADDEPAKAVPVAEALPALSTPADPDDDAVKATAIRALVATIQIDDSTQLTGTILETTELPMKTSFGEANIPLSEVAGIKFADEGVSTTTVVLHNGDAISGATELDRLVVATQWGKAEINGPSISSILFSQGVNWVSDDGLTGKRWKLVNTESEKPKTAAASTQPAPSTTPRTLVRSPDGSYYYR